MIGGLLILIGMVICVGVLFTPIHWFTKDGRFSRVDKGQFIGVAIIFIGVIWSVAHEIRIS